MAPAPTRRRRRRIGPGDLLPLTPAKTVVNTDFWA
jgi:hypothetical protein